MFTAIKRSEGGNGGFTWFEVFKNGETTGYQYNALDEAHALRMYNQGIKIYNQLNK